MLFGLDLPHKGISLVLEDAYLLYRTVGCKGLLQHLLAEGGQGAVYAAHINGAIGGTALVVDLIEGQWLYVLCSKKKKKNRIINNSSSFFQFSFSSCKFISISHGLEPQLMTAVFFVCVFFSCLFRADIAFILPAA